MAVLRGADVVLVVDQAEGVSLESPFWNGRERVAQALVGDATPLAHRLLVGEASDGVEAERPTEDDETRCAACDAELDEQEVGRPVCRDRDQRLERELAAYLSFVAVRRE